MSFLTEDADTVNTMNTENELKYILQNIREELKNKQPVYRTRMWGVCPDGFYPTNPEASNHPVDDYKWADRYDHPKD